MFYRWLSKSPNYIRQFGLWNGLRLLFSVETAVDSKTGDTRQYSVKGYPNPIFLRETVSDHSIFWQCIVQRQYDISAFSQSERLMSAYREALEKNETPLIIDCGGNIGLSALYLATTYPKAKVYVIEPDEKNYAMLQKNTEHFGDRVVALKGGVWHESDHLQIINPESGSAAFRVAPAASDAENTLRTYTIAEICALAGTSSPFMVKIDIEGAQKHLFKSNTDWVGNTHLIMLELDDWLMPWQGTSRPFFSCVSGYPFDYLISGETIFCFRDFGAET